MQFRVGTFYYIDKSFDENLHIIDCVSNGVVYQVNNTIENISILYNNFQGHKDIYYF